MEGLARVRRLEKQQELLRSRGAEMLRRGLQTLDELDEVEETERKERETEQALGGNEPKASLETRVGHQPTGFLGAAEENPLPFSPSF